MFGGAFIVTPPDVNNYKDVLFGESYREKSANAAERARFLVEEMQAEYRNLTRTIEKNLEVKSTVLDVVISGGGFRGQYAGGVLSILTLLEEQGVLRIDRWAGTSIGACTAASFATGMDYENFFRVPYAWQGVWQKKEFWKGGPVVREMMVHTLPDDDVHEQLSGRLSVSITVFEGGLWPRNVLVNQFESKEELIDALVAGASIPFFTGNPVFGQWKGDVAMDGGVTLNTPTFKDGKNPQLVINLGYVKYPVAYTFGPLDPNHERLAYEGMDDVIKLLTGKFRNKSLLILKDNGTEGGGGGRGEGGESFLDVINEFCAAVMHFVEFDAVPWTFHGFGFEIMVAFLASCISLKFFGVYDHLIY